MSGTKTTKPRRTRRTRAGASAIPAAAAGPAAAAAAGVSPEERHRMIAEAAYFRALARGFAGGDPLADWLAAEAEIDRMLAAATTARQ